MRAQFLCVTLGDICSSHVPVDEILFIAAIWGCFIAIPKIPVKLLLCAISCIYYIHAVSVLEYR